jgi:MFS family permease
MYSGEASKTRLRLGSRFHKLFGSTAISAIGTGMHAAALPLLVVQLTDDPVALGLVVVAVEIPWVLVSLHAGVLVDRLDRRRVMVWADAGRCAVLVGLSVVILTSQANLAWLVAVGFALGVGQVFFDVAAQAAIPDLVPRDQQHLSVANGRIAAAETNGEDFVGPPLGSVLFGLWNVLPFVGNALSFAGSGALIMSIGKGGKTEETSEVPRESVWKEITQGIRWLLRSRPLRVLAITAGLGNIVFSAQFAMLVLLAKHVLGLANAGYGLLLTAAAVGGTTGGLTVTAASRRFGPGTVLLVAKIAEGLAILVLGLTGNVWVAGAMMIVTGALMTAQKVVTGTLRQQLVPRHIFGRVLSVSRLLAMAGGPVGAALGGVLASAFTVQTPYLVGGVFLVLVALLAYPALNNRALASAVEKTSLAPAKD